MTLPQDLVSLYALVAMPQLGFLFKTSSKPKRFEQSPVSVTTPNTKRAHNSPHDQITLLTERVSKNIHNKRSLEQELRAKVGPGLILKLTNNVSTMISSRRKGRALYVRVHQMFTTAPKEVIDALAAFVGANKPSPEQEKLLDCWIESQRSIIRQQRENEAVQPIGEFHDLSLYFARLNKVYFDDRIKARITWTLAAQKRKRTSIQMGSYSDELKLIRIHPALDQSWVPRYFVEFVIYHEMLHQAFPPSLGAPNGATVHTPKFREEERKFKHFEKARRFETIHLERLLRY